MGRVTGRNVVKAGFARIRDGAVEATFWFQFNPTDLQRRREPQWSMHSSPGSEVPIAIFNHVGSERIELTLLLDARETFDPQQGGTRAQQAWLESMAMQDPDDYLANADLFNKPADYRLLWGVRTWPIVVRSVSVKEEVFNEDLEPVRARVQMTLETRFDDLATLTSQASSFSALRSLVEV